MTQLEGYRCDECGVTSAEKPGNWLRCQTARVEHGQWVRGGMVGGWESQFSSVEMHYCSKDCAVTAIALLERFK